jgi:hypothetical protein
VICSSSSTTISQFIDWDSARMDSSQANAGTVGQNETNDLLFPVRVE